MPDVKFLINNAGMAKMDKIEKIELFSEGLKLQTRRFSEIMGGIEICQKKISIE